MNALGLLKLKLSPTETFEERFYDYDTLLQFSPSLLSVLPLLGLGPEEEMTHAQGTGMRGLSTKGEKSQVESGLTSLI